MSKQQKGMFLPGILLTTVVATMFIGAALSLAPTGFLRAQQSANELAAEKAAQAGIEYALARLQQDSHWKGDALQNIQDSYGLVVREDRGNVVGLLRDDSGLVSQFRFRFNLQNGEPANDFDRMKDPATLVLDFPLVSFSNVLGGGTETVPAGTDRPQQSVSANSIYLAVEGRAGRALSGLSDSQVNGPLGHGGFSHKVIRCAFAATASGPQAVDAVTMAASSMHATLPVGGSGQVSLSGGTNPRIRSRGNLTVEGGAATNFTTAAVAGEYRVPSGFTSQAAPDQKLKPKEEIIADDFYKVKWADVPKVSATPAKLPAGTYVFGDDNKLHYYDVAPKDYPAYIDANPTDLGTETDLSGGPVDLVAGVKASVSNGKANFSVTSDLLIEKSAGGTEDFGVIPRKGAAPAPNGDANAGTSVSVANVFGNNQNNQDFTVPPSLRPLVRDALVSANANTSDNNNYNISGLFPINYAHSCGILHIGNPVMRAVVESMLNYQINQGGYGQTAGSPQTPAIKNSKMDPEDIQVTLTSPNPGKNIVLFNKGSVLFGAQLDGKTSAIVSEGEIRVVGSGTDVSAAVDPAHGLSLYAKGDVTLSTFNPANPNKLDSNNQPLPDRFNKINLTGIIYTWGDFKALAGTTVANVKWGSFKLNGALVAYGGDPAGLPGSAAGKGKVDIVGNSAELTFNPAYLVNLVDQPKVNFSRAWWSEQ